MGEGGASAGISHLIFDFFGTLVAYSPSRTDQGYPASHAYYRAAGGTLDYERFLACWVAGFSELDAATAESHREYSMADGGQAFQRHASFAAEPDTLATLTSLYLQEWSRGVRYIEGVSSMLERLGARFDLSIITNTHDLDLVPGHLRAMNVEPLFSQVVTSVGFGRRKPAASIFEYALRELAVTPDRCLYIGDSYTPDFEGPRAIGVKPLLVDPGRTAPIDPKQRLDSILQLEELLRA